jgi:hypothetical protein
VIVQSETHLDLPGGVDWANEPRPISLDGDRGAWDTMGGIDLDQTNQIDLPDGRAREIARNDYQGGNNPVQGTLPHCDLADAPDLPTIGIGGFHVWDMPDLPNGPSVPGPC